MNLKVKKTFKITSKRLFVVVVDADYDDLVEMGKVSDQENKLSLSIHSIELVNISITETFPGITLSYTTDEELDFLELSIKEHILAE